MFCLLRLYIDHPAFILFSWLFLSEATRSILTPSRSLFYFFSLSPFLAVLAVSILMLLWMFHSKPPMVVSNELKLLLPAVLFACMWGLPLQTNREHMMLYGQGVYVCMVMLRWLLSFSDSRLSTCCQCHLRLLQYDHTTIKAIGYDFSCMSNIWLLVKAIGFPVHFFFLFWFTTLR